MTREIPITLVSGLNMAVGTVVAVLTLAISPIATAQVFKCVDKNGRTSYQQLPCAETQKGGRMALPGASTSAQDGSDAEWAAKASRKQVVVGMPRAYVVQAYGTPEEMRPGQPDENATEVWRYSRKNLDLGLGFSKGVVVWTKDGAATAAPIVQASESSRRRNFAVARQCTGLMAEAGQPVTSVQEEDAALARTVIRHTWVSDNDDHERTEVICVDGIVARVERVPD